MSATAALVLFCKLPVPGQVKTRLAAGLGAANATEFYRACAEHVLKEAACVQSSKVYIFYATANDEEGFRSWLQPLVHVPLTFLPQFQSPDLGQRMQHALEQVLALGHARAVVVGTDVPDLAAAHLSSALRAVECYDVVFGPAEDGGYYLVGIRCAHRTQELFKGIEWSTSTVLQTNLSNAQRLGLSVAPLLPMLRDIDTIRDLTFWASVPESQSSLLHIARRMLTSAACLPAAAQQR